MHIHLIEPDPIRFAALHRQLEHLGHCLKDAPDQADICLVSDLVLAKVSVLRIPFIVIVSKGQLRWRQQLLSKVLPISCAIPSFLPRLHEHWRASLRRGYRRRSHTHSPC